MLGRLEILIIINLIQKNEGCLVNIKKYGYGTFGFLLSVGNLEWVGFLTFKVTCTIGTVYQNSSC